MKRLIYMDFAFGGSLSKIGSQRDLERNGVVLREGMELLLYQADEDENNHPGYLFTDAVVHWDMDRNRWIARYSEVRFAQVETPEQLRLPGIKSKVVQRS
jgi:hypothetical protein